MQHIQKWSLDFMNIIFLLATCFQLNAKGHNNNDESSWKKQSKGKKKVTSSNSDASLEIQIRKLKQPNWEHGEVLALM
jgi:hypothetical protein